MSMPPLDTTALSRQRLRRSRIWALGLLLLACALFVVSCLLLHRYPALGYLKAFSEAAMVGALADWFAVTALFRHPLGLPIPHTAILPRKQSKIGDEIGRFIAHNFLQGKSIAVRVYQLHPTQKMLDWLTNQIHQQSWLPLLSAQIPALLRAAKPQDVSRFVGQLIDSQYSGEKLGQTLANVLQLLNKQGIDTVLLRALMKQIRRWLQDDATRQMLETSLLTWAGKIEKEAPNAWDKFKSSLKTTLAERVDDWVAGKALDWADSYLAAALVDDQHTLWRGYRKQIVHSIRQLRRNPLWHQRLAAGRHQLAQSPALQTSLAHMWSSFIEWSEDDVGQSNSWWQTQIERLLTHMQLQASHYPQFMRRVDARLALAVKAAVEQYKHQAGQFVADKVKSWDSRQMVDKLELSVGRDLQFIRINGTLVGGLIGLVIYGASQFLLQ
ncbi:DUF445 domain-containing protein [Snodgrassella sp. CFCC 13594]|uniref:DUF445 domain-containing protein n=1 Tax=Snodgrassella sp. CFCC 13594 TaxID=1775559 RepID=UPI000830C353|nr:DUF445 domain-containing protein [Snodgrassella sp. CFCC 13594]